MSELARTMVVCGLISGTQPFTIMGLLLVRGGGHGRRNAWWYLFGCFSIQAVIVLLSGLVVGGAVDESSGGGHTLIGVRIAAGVALFVLGIWLRRAPATDPPDTPKIFDRLTNLRRRGAFVAGVAIADYQGSMLAATALATASVTSAQQFEGWLLYCLFATGLPTLAIVAINHSARAKGDLERAIAWIMANRRRLSSWICLFGGLALFGDGLMAYLAAS